MSITVELRDKQMRHYSLIKENTLFCIFTKKDSDKEEGWCRWHKDNDGHWYGIVWSSRGCGKAIARKSFGDMLDDIQARLILEKELGDAK